MVLTTNNTDLGGEYARWRSEGVTKNDETTYITPLVINNLSSVLVSSENNSSNSWDYSALENCAYVRTILDASTFNAMNESNEHPVTPLDAIVQFEDFVHYYNGATGHTVSSVTDPPVLENPLNYEQGRYKEPKNCKDIAKLPELERNLWYKAQDDEWFKNVLANTVTAVKLSDVPVGSQVLACIFVYKYKFTTKIYKARTVVLGNRQLNPPDNVFAPTVPVSAFRLFLTIYQSALFRTNNPSAVLHSGDCTAAFCSAKLEDDNVIFIQAPIQRYKRPGICYRLTGALYGLKESPRLWYLLFSKLIRNAGWQQSEYENCLFFKLDPSTGHLCGILLIYVDDVIAACTDIAWISLLKSLNKEIKIVDLHAPTDFLGMQIHETSAGTYVTQTKYIKKMLKTFAVDFGGAINTAKTPGDVFKGGCILQKVANVTDPSKFQRQIGSLNYAATHTRPDISFSCKTLSSHLLGHDETHFVASKRVFRYLNRGSGGVHIVPVKVTNPPSLSATAPGLFAVKDGPFHIATHSDADWAGPGALDRRSTTGMVMMIDSLPVAYYSKSQASISLSTTEAELYALSNAIRTCGYFRDLLSELHMIPNDYRFRIHCDNKAAIDILNNAASVVPSKHIDIRLKYLQNQVARRLVEVVYVSTNENLADIFTKSLAADQHIYLSSRMMHSYDDFVECNVSSSASSTVIKLSSSAGVSSSDASSDVRQCSSQHVSPK